MDQTKNLIILQDTEDCRGFTLQYMWKEDTVVSQQNHLGL
jgi:hypothetical protein